MIFCTLPPQVDLRFPQSGAPDPNLVTVMGRPEQVDEAIDHLLNLEEEYVSCAANALVLAFVARVEDEMTEGLVSPL